MFPDERKKVKETLPFHARVLDDQFPTRERPCRSCGGPSTLESTLTFTYNGVPSRQESWHCPSCRVTVIELLTGEKGNA